MVENFEKIKKKTRTKYKTNIDVSLDYIKVKPGMCFFDDAVSNKHRLAVVLKVINNVVFYALLTSSRNDRSFKPVDSIGFEDKYFCYTLSKTYLDYVKCRAIKDTISKKRIIEIIKDLKYYWFTNL